MIFHRTGLTASWRADPKLKPLGNTVGMSDQVTLMSILRMVSSLVYGDIGEARCGGTSNGAPVGRSLHLQDACGLPYLRRGQCVTCLSTLGVLSDMFERSAWVTLGRVRSLPKKKRARGCCWRSRNLFLRFETRDLIIGSVVAGREDLIFMYASERQLPTWAITRRPIVSFVVTI